MEILISLLKRELKIKNEKIIFKIIFINIFILSIIIVILSTIGIETNKFNEIISEKVNETNNIKLELDTIKFKLDPKELSLFLETKKPKNKLSQYFDTCPIRKNLH